jgi:hypothetical protein
MGALAPDLDRHDRQTKTADPPDRQRRDQEKERPVRHAAEKKPAAEADAAKAETARWKVRIAQLEKTNGHVDAVWDTLCGDSDRYLPPVRDTDAKLLMDLFGRSTKSIMKQVHAINQIVSQGGEPARAFEVLQTGKDIEICLLAACFQNPELYLGRKQTLKQLLGGFKGSNFPLILRYLPQHIRA